MSSFKDQPRNNVMIMIIVYPTSFSRQSKAFLAEVAASNVHLSAMEQLRTSQNFLPVRVRKASARTFHYISARSALSVRIASVKQDLLSPHFQTPTQL